MSSLLRQTHALVRHACARYAIASLLLLVVTATTGCDGPGKPTRGERPLRPDQVMDFGTLFAQNCSGCHGAKGMLGPAPPLNDAIFLAIISKEQMHKIVREGRHGTLMPAFDQAQGGPLTSQQIDSIVEGIREEWGREKVPDRQALPSYLLSGAEGKSPKSHAAGEKAYANACAECHGDHGEGGPMAGPLRDPAFLSLVSDQALRRVIITGRPDLGMPDFRSSDMRTTDFKPLTSEEITSIVDLLRSWREAKSAAPALSAFQERRQ